MKKMMENLLALQDLQLRRGRGAREREDEIEGLRRQIPEPILGHYDRLLARGKKGVALVSHGVCSECHMRVPIGTLVTLAHGQDVQLCGNCGRYLFLPAGELTPEPKALASSTPPSRRGRKSTAPSP
jgi:predicted  nucleic acid-binding Zn-ribbon protein